MFDGLMASLRAWLEGIREWLLLRPEFSWLHEWVATTHVSTIWAIVVGVLFVLVLVVGFWPPLKPETEEAGETMRSPGSSAPQGR